MASSAAVIAGANGAMERDYEFATVIRAADLPDPASLGRQAAERAARRLNPRKVKSQAVPVVFEPRVAGSIVRHLVSAISGPAVARGTTFLKDSMGERIFAEGISIVEDPLREGGLRSRAFDAEGIAVQPRRLIDRGVLTTWLLDCASARQLGLQTDRARGARRLVGRPRPPPPMPMSSPARSPEDLIRDIKRLLRHRDDGHGHQPRDRRLQPGRCGLLDRERRDRLAGQRGHDRRHPAEHVRGADAGERLSFRYGIDAPTLRIEGMTVAGQ